MLQCMLSMTSRIDDTMMKKCRTNGSNMNEMKSHGYHVTSRNKRLVILLSFLLLLCSTLPRCRAFVVTQKYPTHQMPIRQPPLTLWATFQEPSAQEQLDQALPARYVAVDAMIERKGTFALDKLESLVAQSGLSTRDRSFARLLVTECMRRLGQIDKVLEMCQTKKNTSSNNNNNNNNNKKLRLSSADRFVQAVLRIGAVQLLFLGTPSHAAVKETVDLLRIPKELHVPEAKIKYVNAVLRRLGREGDTLLAQTEVTDNAAPWLVQELTQAWGTAATRGIIESAMRESPRCLTLKQGQDGEANDKILQRMAALFVDSILLPQGSLMILNPPTGKINDWPRYEDGEWWLQDVSATLPAIALHNSLRQRGPIDQQHVVDLCAAPGGKTAQLCSFGFGTVTAVEVSSRRSKRLQENIQRLNLDCRVVVADGTEWLPDTKVDGVLIDAPCTATGTGSKRPDVLRKDSNHQELLDTQYRLLCHVADNMLPPGGILVYATCSLLPQESEDQIRTFLSRRDSDVCMETLPIQPNEISGFGECIDADGWLRVIPGTKPSALYQYHVDGFFVARLQRTK